MKRALVIEMVIWLSCDLWIMTYGKISCTHGLIQAVGPGQHGSRPPEQGGYPKGQRDDWAESEDDRAKWNYCLWTEETVNRWFDLGPENFEWVGSLWCKSCSPWFLVTLFSVSCHLSRVGVPHFPQIWDFFQNVSCGGKWGSEGQQASYQEGSLVDDFYTGFILWWLNRSYNDYWIIGSWCEVQGASDALWLLSACGEDFNLTRFLPRDLMQGNSQMEDQQLSDKLRFTRLELGGLGDQFEVSWCWSKNFLTCLLIGYVREEGETATGGCLWQCNCGGGGRGWNNEGGEWGIST